MRILYVHNRYQQAGGEDQVFADETSLLESKGHEVLTYTAHNDAIVGMSRARLAGRTIWSPGAYGDLRRLLRRERPHVVHFHNTFPLISPAAYYAARAEGVAVVQTLHNYRLLCVNAQFFRDGRVCEDCLGKALPWPGVLHACYRGDRAASATVAAMLAGHRALGSWNRMVDVYVALSEFTRAKFVEGGLPAEKIVVKPNFVHPDPGAGEGHRDYALFVGRLTAEKGISVLLEAWAKLGVGIPLKIVGDGPARGLVIDGAARMPDVEWLGAQPLERVYALTREAAFLVVPSIWYEGGLPKTIVEAFAVGTPVIAARIGGMTESVRHRVSGLLFRPGDGADLADTAEWAWTHPESLVEMGRGARRAYEAEFSAEVSYARLVAIFQRAIAGSQARAARPGESAPRAVGSSLAPRGRDR